MKIYIVEGRTGEWADAREWPVKAFKEEEKAKAFKQLLNDTAKKLGVYSSGLRLNDGQANVALMQELDPGVSIDYTGVQYDYYELELE